MKRGTSIIPAGKNAAARTPAGPGKAWDPSEINSDSRLKDGKQGPGKKIPPKKLCIQSTIWGDSLQNSG